MKRIQTGMLCMLLLPSLSAPLQAEPHRQHEAHFHGEARLLLAIEGRQLQIEFSSPAMNLVGFEHAPHTVQQQQAVQQAVATLRSGEIFELPAAAGCTLQEADVGSGLLPHKHGHEAGHMGHAEHNDFDADYVYLCAHMEQLDHIDVQLFKHFPATHEIEVEMVTDRGQSAATLTAREHRLKL